MTKRKNVTWRIEDHSESEKLNKWLDQQKHIQQSIATLVLHAVDKYGYVNMTDYQMQKKLISETAYINQPPEVPETEKEANEEANEAVEQSGKTSRPEKKEENEDAKRDKSKEDKWKNVNPENL